MDLCVYFFVMITEKKNSYHKSYNKIYYQILKEDMLIKSNYKINNFYNFIIDS